MQRRLRLRRNEDFQRLRQSGRSVAHALLVISVAPNTLPHNRYGIITSRRLGAAVERNRAKRRIREAIRHWHPQIRQGYDVVFIARRGALDRPYPEVLSATQWLFRRTSLLESDEF